MWAQKEKTSAEREEITQVEFGKEKAGNKILYYIGLNQMRMSTFVWNYFQTASQRRLLI